VVLGSVRDRTDRGPPRAPGEGVPLPRTVREAVGGRIGRLPKNTRSALLTAAAIAAPSVDRVHQLAGGSSGLKHAVAAGIVDIAGGEITFVHPLLAAAAYEGVPAAERRSV